MAGIYAMRGFILHGVLGLLSGRYAQCGSLSSDRDSVDSVLAVYNGCAALFRTMGNSKTAMQMSLFMNAINIIGNAA